MQSVERFTQSAYLRTAAINLDSKIFESDQLSYVQSFSAPERWFNSVVRLTRDPRSFKEVQDLIQEFDSKNINFNWHVWHSTAPQNLIPFLINEVEMTAMGKVDFLKKELHPVQENFRVLEDLSTCIFRLDSQFLDRYVDAKVKGWKSRTEDKSEIERAAMKHLEDPRNDTYVFMRQSQVIGAVGSFSDSQMAYLRGDFVIPEFRNQGFYKKLIRYREAALSAKGITHLTVLADPDSSSPIYQKLNYNKLSEISIFARKKSAWLSL